MSTRIPVPLLTADKPYPQFKLELSVWKDSTDLAKEKQAAVVALTLPEAGKFSINIRAKVFEEIGDDLGKQDGMDKLLAFLDKHLGKDELAEAFEKYVKFEDYVRRSDQNISQYIAEFDSLYKKLEKQAIVLPPEILAFKLIKSANLPPEKTMFIKSEMDYKKDKRSEMYMSAQSALKKYFGESSVCGSDISGNESAISQNTDSVAVKTESILYTRGRGRGFQSFRGSGRGSSYGYSQGEGRGRSHGTGRGNRGRGGVNAPGPDGNPRRCRGCGSYKHFVKNCPHEEENVSAYYGFDGDAFDDEEATQEMCLFTHEVSVLTNECTMDAVIDIGCTHTVCGERWMLDYLKMIDLNPDDVRIGSSHKVFKGIDAKLPSKGRFIIPAEIVGTKVKIETDVIDSDIPLLLSKKSMKAMKMKVDTEHDTASILGISTDLHETSSGHYAISIYPEKEKSVYVSKLVDESNDLRLNSLKKLHTQFGHASKEKMRKLLIDGNVWKSSFASDLAEITEKCEICQRYKKSPPRSVVAMPMASDFNQLVAVDLKVLKNGYILHMIDTFTRFSVSVFLKRKLPSAVIDAIMLKWVSVFGVMIAILSDNGGEFSNDEMREVASVLHVRLFTTAADSPYQNGICEKVHGVVDSTYEKLEAQCPRTDKSVLLAWANMAKNSLHMNHGFSPYQLVFGRNPNLPNVIKDGLPVLDEISSPTLQRHLNALHGARQAFIQSEASEKLKRALKAKVRQSVQVFQPGDEVYYRKDHCNKSLGPAKVLAQDGKLVFVRHGGQILRITPSRLTACNPKDVVIEVKPEAAGLKQVFGKKNPGFSVINMNVKKMDDDHIEYYQELDEELYEETVSVQNEGLISAIQDQNNPEIDQTPEEQDQATEERVFVTFLTKEEIKSPKGIAAKKTELEKLKTFDAYVEVDDMGQKRISTRFVMTKKSDGEFRARLVARGYEEEGENIPVDSPTVSKSAIRVCIAVAVGNGWKLEITDIKSAFLQSRPIERDVFVAPPPEAECETGKMWKLKRVLYGLSDAAREFYLSLKDELTKLGCVISKLDNSVFFKYENNQLIGVLVTHVDDFLHAGTEEFTESVIEPLCKRFQASTHEERSFMYVGYKVTQEEQGVVLDQEEYVDEMEEVPVHIRNDTVEFTREEQSMLRSAVGGANWVVNGTRPECSFETLALSTKFNNGCSEDLKSANKLIRKIKMQPSVIFFPKLTKKWKLVVFTDAAFANLPDKVSSTSSYVILLVDEHYKCCPLEWRSKKIKRVVKSSLAAEVMALQEGLEAGIVLAELISELMPDKKPAIYAKTDSKSLVDNIQSTRAVDEKVLRINIAAIKEFITEYSIMLQWIPHELQLADAMTKKGASGERLVRTIQSGVLDSSYLF